MFWTRSILSVCYQSFPLLFNIIDLLLKITQIWFKCTANYETPSILYASPVHWPLTKGGAVIYIQYIWRS